MKKGNASLLVLLTAIGCAAQTPVAPTTEPVGPPRGDNWSGYNISNSFETGYRFQSVSGNLDKYRSDENFGNGVRLLSGFLSLNSKNGLGRYFDELLLTVGGLGGDPYQSARFRLSKNRWYRYDLYWRQNDYVNPGLTTGGAAGVHLLETAHALQDHDLTLFPQSAVRIFLGYTRNSQSGAGISTVQLFNTAGPFDQTGSIFPVFTNVKIQQNEFRVGGEGRWRGFTLNAIRGWEGFKDDTPFAAVGPLNGDGFGAPANVAQFNRTSPYHGTSPFWRVGLFRNDSRWSLAGRFTYTSGRRTFLSNENAIGLTQFGSLANQQIITTGSGRRPVATGNLNLTGVLSPKLTITSSTSVYNVRTEGNSAYLQFDNATQSSQFFYFQYLGIRTVATNLIADYRFNDRVSVHGGYEFSDRRIASSPQFAFAGSTPGEPYVQTNRLHTGILGFRINATKALTVSMEGAIGRNDQPFTPKSDANYRVFASSVRYKLRKLQLSAQVKGDYNVNSTSLSTYFSHSRTYTAAASWAPVSWFGLDGSYSKLHLDTLGGIAFFAGPQSITNTVSTYISNIHSGTLTARISVKRLDIYAGYSHVQDTGDGRSDPASTGTGPSIVAFQTAQTFPLSFRSPSARLSLRLHERLRWNFGYQYYGYREQFLARQNYLAHTGYTSLLWSF